MGAADILLRSRDAAGRLMDIDEELELMRSRIGVKGHSCGFTSKNDIRDPMRHVDALIDATIDLDAERTSCVQDVEEGKRLCCGVARKVSEGLGRILLGYYIHRQSVHEVSDALHVSHSLIERCIARTTLDELDRYGAPKLLAAGAKDVRTPKPHTEARFCADVDAKALAF